MIVIVEISVNDKKAIGQAPFGVATIEDFFVGQSALHQLIVNTGLDNLFYRWHWCRAFCFAVKGDCVSDRSGKVSDHLTRSELTIGCTMISLIKKSKAELGALPTETLHLAMFESLIQREVERVASNNKRARDRGLAATLTLGEWLWTLNLFRFKCAYCKKAPYGSMDHVLPLDAGGATVKDNCVPACMECNQAHEKVHTRQKAARGKLAELACVMDHG